MAVLHRSIGALLEFSSQFLDASWLEVSFLTQFVFRRVMYRPPEEDHDDLHEDIASKRNQCTKNISDDISCIKIM